MSTEKATLSTKTEIHEDLKRIEKWHRANNSGGITTFAGNGAADIFVVSGPARQMFLSLFMSIKAMSDAVGDAGTQDGDADVH